MDNFSPVTQSSIAPSLNVLHVNTWWGIGGAFVAAERLHLGLVNSGVNSTFGYGRVLYDRDAGIKGLSQYQFIEPKASKLEGYLIRFAKKLGLNDLGSISSFSLQDRDYFQNADVLNFHNLHGDFFSYAALPQLTLKKPAVWTLHDMWSFTGHCTYSYDCARWQVGCGQCPYPEIEHRVQRDGTHWEWQLKNWVYQRSNLAIVTPSQWLANQAKQSILNRFPIHHIPYGIDTTAYQPLDPEQCRSLLGVESGKKVLLFGAQSLKYTRKGGDLLLQALQSLPEALKAELILLTFGDSGESVEKMVGIPTLNLGYISSDRLKAIAYSAADLFVFPTRADNLPLVLQESLACGTPMVSFKVGGVPELVRPGITGYLAEPENVKDFSEGIVQLLSDQALRESMSRQCRSIAITEYPLERQAERYLELYKQVLHR